jgi:AraC-like DNA-binding protein
LEAETLTLKLLARGMVQRSLRAASSGNRSQKLVNQAKVVISEDLGRRWMLAEIADLVGVSPVYLTQVFQRVEGMPLYQYQLQLRLAKALDLLGIYANLTDLALTHGFSCHSHFVRLFSLCEPVSMERRCVSSCGSRKSVQ